MKILLVTQYFWPESFRINDLAIELVNRGHEVTVLTGKPNYPSGKFFEGYNFWGRKTEYLAGVKIIRLPIIPRGKGGGLLLALNYFSYAFIASVYAFFIRNKYDVSFTFATSPITAAFPALTYRSRRKTPTCIWVQDLWPESVAAASNVKSSFIMKLLNRMVSFIYNRCDKILISSRGFRSAIVGKYGHNAKVEYIPNWAEDLYSDSKSIDINKYKSIVPSGFIVMFAGNIGEAQDFESILKSAELTQEYSDIKWVIVGDGRKKLWLEEEVTKRNLHNIYLLGRYPLNEMPSFFYHADIMLMTLKDEKIFSLTVPSKLQSYMAFGKPVVTMLNGEGSQVVNDASCGLCSNASNSDELARNIIKLYQNRDIVDQLGRNGKEYYEKEFKKEMIVSKIERIFKELNGSKNC